MPLSSVAFGQSTQILNNQIVLLFIKKLFGNIDHFLKCPPKKAPAKSCYRVSTISKSLQSKIIS